MQYVSHTDEERQRMLESMGCTTIEDLFVDVPRELRCGDLELPEGMSEPEVFEQVQRLAERNLNLETVPGFLGGGAYHGYVPAAVGAITGRAEFYTAYTPYQAEVSQGTLQVIYEFQSMIALLTGMEAANASLYDGATALAEAASMALNATRRNRVAVLDSVNPDSRRVLETYATGIGYDVDTIPAMPSLDANEVSARLGQDHACLIAQNPDYTGRVIDMRPLADAIHERGGLFVAAVDPISLALLASPGEYGADIAVGEGQGLGAWTSFGGPYLGFMATTEALQRRMPGRIVGGTVDSRGQRAFVLTLQTREQHIRRERATSNICTNEALVALNATAYMALLGPDGLRRVAELCLQRAHYAARRIAQVPGSRVVTPEPFFREFAISGPVAAAEINRRLLERRIIGGIELGSSYPDVPELSDALLLAFTDQTDRAQIDSLVDALESLVAFAPSERMPVAGGVR